MNLSGVSLFASAGLAECYLREVGVNILVANELLQERARLYQSPHPQAQLICGDILNEKIFTQRLQETPENLDFLLASPPCQGMSVAGKNRNQKQMQADKRNMLIFRVLEFIAIKKPKYILIENVPNFLRLKFEFKGKNLNIAEILQSDFKDYVVEARILNAADFGVAQIRKRAIVKMYQRGLKWQNPTKERQKSVLEAIGDLPSLEAGEKSSLKWHFARKHSKNHIECLKHTKTGESALNNPIFYPTNKGKKVKAYNTSYKRIKWDEPAPTITIRNDAISSQHNVHPGRLQKDGTYSDARVLTPLELILLSSLPIEWDIPDNTPELLIRRCLGECIPPLLVKKIVSGIGI